MENSELAILNRERELAALRAVRRMWAREFITFHVPMVILAMAMGIVGAILVSSL